jgi:hypothetical protein
MDTSWLPSNMLGYAFMQSDSMNGRPWPTMCMIMIQFIIK